MDPEVNPSKVLPIDFLPNHFRAPMIKHDQECVGLESDEPSSSSGQFFSQQKHEALHRFYSGFPVMEEKVVPVKVKKDNSSGYRTAEEASEAYMRRLYGKLDMASVADDLSDPVNARNLTSSVMNSSSRLDLLDRPNHTLSRGARLNQTRRRKKLAGALQKSRAVGVLRAGV